MHGNDSLVFATLGVLYIGILIYFTIGKKGEMKDDSKFLIAGRSVGLLPLSASLASGFRDGAGIAVWLTLGIYYGLGAIWLAVGLAIGLAIVGLMSRTSWEIAKSSGYISVTELIHDKVGRRTAYICSSIVVGTSFLYFSAQLFVAGKVGAEIFSWPEWIGIGFVGIITLSYSMIGGLNSIIRTDTIQWILILIVVMVPFLFSADPVVPEISTFYILPTSDFIGFLIFPALVAFSGAEVWQRVFSARDSGVARIACFSTGPMYVFLGVGLILVGTTAVSNGIDVTSEEGVFQIFEAEGVFLTLKSILFLFILSSIMSTADTQAYLLASTISRVSSRMKYGTNDVLTSRVLLCFVFVMAWTVTTFISDIVGFLFGAVTLTTIMAPIILISLLKVDGSKLRDKLLGICLFISLVVYIWMFVNGSFSQVINTLIPPSICAALVIVALIFLSLWRKGTPSDDGDNMKVQGTDSGEN